MSLIEVDWKPGERQLRTFGVICAAVCLGLVVLVLWRGSILGIELELARARQASAALGFVAVMSAALALTAPKALLPLYVVATAISLPIGFVVSYAILGVLFYLVLTPFGLVFRLLKRDVLARDFDRSAGSYWVRRPPVNDTTRYYHQY